MQTALAITWRTADEPPGHDGTVLLATNDADPAGPRFVTGWHAGADRNDWHACLQLEPLPPGAVDWWAEIPAPPELPHDPPRDDATTTEDARP